MTFTGFVLRHMQDLRRGAIFTVFVLTVCSLCSPACFVCSVLCLSRALLIVVGFVCDVMCYRCAVSPAYFVCRMFFVLHVLLAVCSFCLALV